MSTNGPPNGTDAPRSSLVQAAFQFLVALAVTLPVCMFLWPHLPLMQVPAIGGMGLDRLALFLVVLIALVMLLRRLPLLSYGTLIVAIGVITFQGLRGGYGFSNLFADYGTAIGAMSQRTKALPDVAELRPFKGAEELRAAMDFKDPLVRSFAVRAATTYFNEEAAESDHTMIQAFSIFKVINSAWVYVSDPADDEYFATAAESVPLLAGDCDDHAVLMAACIKAIGGKVRLVRTTGHIYPEMSVGDAQGMQRAAYLIRNVLFPEEARYADLYYHTDANGDRWINLDYTRHYPGGPVMNEKIIGILHV
ncbi:MAG: transglutaminase family protein [Flavobacteriales bacterium]|nr:transglutaminase family protein [Flavobacteriales bacterium]